MRGSDLSGHRDGSFGAKVEESIFREGREVGEIMKANLKRKAKFGISVGKRAERTSLNVGRPEA